MELKQDDINDLISIGKSLNILDQKLLASFRQRDYVNRQHGDTWRKFVSELSDNDLISVFKALVIIERELNWIGGSVAGAIWVYGVIKQRQLDPEFEIADFGLQNCSNPWIPFGNSYYGKRTIKDYFEYQNEKIRISAIKSERYQKVLKRVEGRKVKRAIAIVELRKLTYEQRGQIRKDLLDKYATVSDIERLTIIANDDIFPPEYYPVEWIKLNVDEIKNLPIVLIRRLYDKLSTKTKGEWKRFAQKLEKLDRP